MIALGAYQAMAVFYIAVCTVFFLLYLLRVAEEGREAAELSETMGIFPAEDSVKETEDFAVVKLSGIEERTDIGRW